MSHYRPLGLQYGTTVFGGLTAIVPPFTSWLPLY